MATLSIQIRTLTPLWTGGVDGTMDRIHETGILGSLRWWYEAIVRGLGGSACDPTGDDRCPDRDGRYCDVCAVFGATGRQRAFRLEGPEWWNDAMENRLTVKVKNNRGWYLGRGYLGDGAFRIVPLRTPQGLAWEDVQQTLVLTMRLIECWGGLGPKTQVGYGVVRFELDAATTIAAFENLKQRNNRRTVSPSSKWPALDGFFFAKVRFKINANITPKQWIQARVSQIDPNEELDWYLSKASNTQREAILPLAPIVRYYLRGLMYPNRPPTSSGYPEPVRHRLMGELGKKSLIHISHAYPVDNGQWEFRIWGWIPEELPNNPEGLPNNMGRADVFNDLRQWLGVQQQRQWHPPQNGALWSDLNLTPTQVCWFERQDNESVADYLQALLNGCK